MSALKQIPASTWCFIVGGFLSFVFVAFGTVLKFSEESRSKQENAKKLLALQTELGEARKDNIRLQNHVTGGDSFPVLRLVPEDADYHLANLLVSQRGDYPLYDVAMRLVDRNILDELSKQEAKQGRIPMVSLTDGASLIRIGTLLPHAATTVGTVQPKQGNSIQFDIFFTARNGSFIERLALKKVDGVWSSAVQITIDQADGTRRVLFAEVDPKFPRKLDGDLDL